IPRGVLARDGVLGPPGLSVALARARGPGLPAQRPRAAAGPGAVRRYVRRARRRDPRPVTCSGARSAMGTPRRDHAAHHPVLRRLRRAPGIGPAARRVPGERRRAAAARGGARERAAAAAPRRILGGPGRLDQERGHPIRGLLRFGAAGQDARRPRAGLVPGGLRPGWSVGRRIQARLRPTDGPLAVLDRPEPVLARDRPAALGPPGAADPAAHLLLPGPRALGRRG